MFKLKSSFLYKGYNSSGKMVSLYNLHGISSKFGGYQYKNNLQVGNHLQGRSKNISQNLLSFFHYVLFEFKWNNSQMGIWRTPYIHDLASLLFSCSSPLPSYPQYFLLF